MCSWSTEKKKIEKKIAKKKIAMTNERIHEEILEISSSIAIMLTEREVDGEIFEYDEAGDRYLTKEARDIFDEHQNIIEEALYELKNTIKARYV